MAFLTVLRKGCSFCADISAHKKNLQIIIRIKNLFSDEHKDKTNVLEFCCSLMYCNDPSIET